MLEREIRKDLSRGEALAIHWRSVSPGPGMQAVLKVGGELYAAYRDRDGRLHTLDPACQHMGCIVAWNDAERSWDCPCHGSRYTALGKVIRGPTVKGLPKKDLKG